MRRFNRLSARTVASLAEPGHHCDGGGLYLQVSPALTKSWVFRFMRDGRSREMGLGAVRLVSLAEARDAAQACRKLVHSGADPIEARQQERSARQLASARSTTFRDCATAFIEAHRAGWRNGKHGAQWQATLERYAHPVLGDLSVQDIDTGLVMKVLEPIWRTRTETASRLRGRIEAILDWATVRDYRHGDNPARWRGHLDHLLPGRSQVQKVEHFAALPYAELPGFMRDLWAQPGRVAARGLAFQILTACRTGEVIGARFEEFDLDRQLWMVPAGRMKAGREHRVALSTGALAILRAAAGERQSGFVFPGLREGRPLSNMAFLQLLKRMGRGNITAHGFRSTFRDWAAEQTGFTSEVVEMALAHAIGNKVEAAYRRGDLFAKRLALMQAWSDFAGGTGSGIEGIT